MFALQISPIDLDGKRAAGTYLNMVRTDLFEIDPLAPYDPLPLPMQFDIILMRFGYAWYSKPKETFTSGFFLINYSANLFESKSGYLNIFSRIFLFKIES